MKARRRDLPFIVTLWAARTSTADATADVGPGYFGILYDASELTDQEKDAEANRALEAMISAHAIRIRARRLADQALCQLRRLLALAALCRPEDWKIDPRIAYECDSGQDHDPPGHHVATHPRR